MLCRWKKSKLKSIQAHRHFSLISMQLFNSHIIHLLVTTNIFTNFLYRFLIYKHRHINFPNSLFDEFHGIPVEFRHQLATFLSKALQSALLINFLRRSRLCDNSLNQIYFPRYFFYLRAAIRKVRNNAITLLVLAGQNDRSNNPKRHRERPVL